MAAKQVVENALDEVQESITFLDLGNIILNSAIAFVALFLITTIFNLTSFIALIPTAVYFIFHVVKAFFVNRYLRVENQIPELKYQLSTVADNVYKANPIVDSLKEDVLKNMHRVKMSEFIDTKTITLKVLSLTIVSILVVIASYYNVDFDLSLDSPLFGGIILPSVRPVGQNISDLNLTYIEGNLTGIFGKGSIARLGTEELQLVINPLASDADVSNIKNVENEDFSPPEFPKEIYTSYDVAYNERIAKENQEVVKNYFERITR